jgi:3-hydroxyisobutyrate dehydrogenase-like beta-hydroxyacid dehydrogenase
MAIMAPVRPGRHLTPVLLAGPHAAQAAEALEALGMRPEIVGSRVGQASAVKMVRSVMIKGLEALVAECFLTARRAGVEDAVLASLEASDPDIRWRERGAYALDRMMVHGTRRAAEMREVAATVEGAGLPARLARATVEWQADIGALALDPGEAELGARLDRILAALGRDSQ